MFKVPKNILMQYGFVIIINLTTINLGFIDTWTSPVLVKLSNDTEGVFNRPVTLEEVTWITSVPYLLVIFALPLASYLNSVIGRKHSLICLCCVPAVIGSIICTIASRVWIVILGRAILGIVEANIVTNSMYSSELASKNARGSLGSILHLCSSIGTLFILCIGPFVSYLLLNIIITAYGIFIIIPIMFLPESPFYLFSKGKVDEALSCLTILRGSKDIAQEEIKEYQDSIQRKVDKRKLYKDRIFLKTALIVFAMGVGNVFASRRFIMIFLQSILDSTHTTVRSEIASVVIGMVEIIASITTMTFIDKFGRKPIYISMLLGICAGMIGLGTFFFMMDTGHQATGAMNYVPLISLIIVCFCHSASNGSLFTLIIAELFEGPLRPIGVAIGLTTSGICMFLGSKYFLIFVNLVGPTLTYFIMALNCVIYSVFIGVCLPETKRKSFAEIQKALGAKL